MSAVAMCLHVQDVSATVAKAVAEAQQHVQVLETSGKKRKHGAIGEGASSSYRDRTGDVGSSSKGKRVKTRSNAAQEADGEAEGSSWKKEEGERYVKALSGLKFEAVSLVEMIEENQISFSFSVNGETKGVDRTANPWGMAPPYGGGGPPPPKADVSQGQEVRIASEVASLAASLPVEHGSSIFVRVDESRPDVIKALIIGPEDTPYAHGLFEFDILLPADYPNSPPLVKFLTTGGGKVRFNPNLYADGKVCLSLLGTWSGPGWDPQTSTLLQVLVSIQALIFVQDPYFNEPGFEASMHSARGKASSSRYNAAVWADTVRHALLGPAKKPSLVFEDVIWRHLALKRRSILEECKRWEAELEAEKERSKAQKEDPAAAKKVLAAPNSFLDVFAGDVMGQLAALGIPHLHGLHTHVSPQDLAGPTKDLRKRLAELDAEKACLPPDAQEVVSSSERSGGSEKPREQAASCSKGALEKDEEVVEVEDNDVVGSAQCFFVVGGDDKPSGMCSPRARKDTGEVMVKSAQDEAECIVLD
eukprot:CAMPEP_0181322120 /NCGR_PEP_ID=MMETSP1101-20121128/19058_1 /TAXON_ID=46948 /ORGANISM="Rhodomonas abbreviata, Strain Caron Lab Isolate" /LENGTH=531 /DNA_ID=CAMNT_0023430011 /DNA_START=33 /DNA_END=1629 /DNA_ORIENTATION=-